MKPVWTLRHLIHNSTVRGDHVLDLFGGSGSTLIAAEQADRRAFLMELDPGYCDVIRRRYETFVGGGPAK
jgi:DNA modification methylase